MKFQTIKKTDHERPPSLVNWLFTIRNFINIWKTVKEEGFEYLLGRHLNQDPIENMFGRIRSHGILNTHPTASAFIAAFKSMMINSALNLYKPSFNCEDDEFNNVFSGIKYLVNSNPHNINFPEFLAEPLSPVPYITLPPKPPTLALLSKLSMLSNNYVAGFILKKIKGKTLCNNCKSCLFCDGYNADNVLIDAREYGGGWARRLCYPTIEFAECFSNIHKIISDVLNNVPHKNNLSNIIKHKITESVNFDFIHCPLHKSDLLNFIIKLSVRTLVHAYCTNINRVLGGKDSRTQAGNNVVKKRALEICTQRYKKKTKKIEISD